MKESFLQDYYALFHNFIPLTTSIDQYRLQFIKKKQKIILII